MISPLSYQQQYLINPPTAMIQEEPLQTDLLELSKDKINLAMLSDLIDRQRTQGQQLVVSLNHESPSSLLSQQPAIGNRCELPESLQSSSSPLAPLVSRLHQHQINQINFCEPSSTGLKSSFLQLYQHDERMHDLLFKLVELSSICPGFVQAASNALYLLNLSNANFFRRNLSYATVKNTSIAGGLFVETTFEGSSFENVDISSAAFVRTNLKSVHWRGIECMEKQFLDICETIPYWHQRGFAFSADDTLLAHGLGGDLISIFDIRANQQIRRFKGSKEHITALSFAPNKSLISVSNQHNSIQLWDLQLEVSQARIEKPLKFNQKRRLGCVSIIKEFSGHKDQVICAEFSSDGRLIVSGSKDKTVRVWDVATGTGLKILKKHFARVDFVSLSPDNKLIASGDEEGCILIWSSETGKPLTRLVDCLRSISALRFLSNSEIIACGYNNTAIKWSVPDGAQLSKLPLRPQRIRKVAISPGGQYIAQALHAREIIIIDTESGNTVACFFSGDTIHRLTYSNDGRLLATTCSSGQVRLWRCFDFKTVPSCPPDFFGVSSLALAMNGRIIAQSKEGIFIRTLPGWSLNIFISKDQLRSLKCALNQLNKDITKVERRILEACSDLMNIDGNSSPLGPMIASKAKMICAIVDEENSIQIWNLERQNLIRKMEQASDLILWLGISPRENVLATVSLEHIVRVYEILSGKVIYTLRPKEQVSKVVFSTDGNFMATVGVYRVLAIREARGGKVVRILKCYDDDLTSVDINRDRRLVLYSVDITIIVWNLLKGVETDHIHSVDDKRIKEAKFSSEGDMIFSIGEDLTLSIWAMHAHGKFYLRQFLRLPGGLIVANAETNDQSIIQSSAHMDLVPYFCQESQEIVDCPEIVDGEDESDDENDFDS